MQDLSGVKQAQSVRTEGSGPLGAEWFVRPSVMHVATAGV
jgi:hypothetical protein